VCVLSLARALEGGKIFVRRIVTDSSLRIGSGRDDKEDALCMCVCARSCFWEAAVAAGGM